MQTELEAKTRNVNVMTLIPWRLPSIEMMIKFKVTIITSQDLLRFDKQIHSGDLIMAEFKFQGDFLRYYRYDSQIHPLTVVT